MRSIFFSVLIFLTFAWSATAQNTTAAQAVARAMDLVVARDWDGALAAASPAGQIGRDIVEWHRLRAGQGTFTEYLDFLERRPDWPGLPLLRKKGEPSIPRSAAPDDVLTYFGKNDPQTGVGALRLAAALGAAGQRDKVNAVLIKAWQTLSMNRDETDAFLQRHGAVLKDHHETRQDMLIWENKLTEAKWLNPLVGNSFRKLTEARFGLLSDVSGVDALIGAVPANLRDHPGLAYARFRWRLDKGRRDNAMELMLASSASAASLGRPEAWADRRRSFSRELMRAGKSKTAYRLASKHHLSGGDAYADLEWLAGFIALTDLEDAERALRHFKRFRAAVASPISLGRAGYWEGRAYEALEQPDNAQIAYAFGAEFQTSFYGQLAAEKIGRPMDQAMAGRESYVDFRTTPYVNSSVMQAADLFQQAGHPLLFTRFIRHLAEVLTPQERGSLAQYALNIDENFAAVYLAKYAANNGAVLMRPYFPAPKIVAEDLAVPRELALAIARRESEFYSRSVSPVGARGLMQLMPGTGKEMAEKLGLSFSVQRLLDDPSFNTVLGSAYLAQLTEEFEGYLPFVAVGYNAGPSRARAWRDQFGDPRGSAEEAVDWIERIPFRETRNYVMRVMESVVVYRARLARQPVEFGLSQALAGR